MSPAPFQNSPTTPTESGGVSILWMILIGVIIVVVIGGGGAYIVHHNMMIDLHYDLKKFGNCETMKNYIEREDQKIGENLILSTVKSTYKEKCL